jgi:hypothetical protein
MNRGTKPPLFRKVNTRARGVRHNFGGDYADQRNRKGEKTSDLTRGSMHGHQLRGLDYTPLFKFLISRVGQPWPEVLREATARLDQAEPIYWLVATNPLERKDYVRIGESSYYSGLYIDEANTLQLVNPAITHETLEPSCACCTHTFNGQRFTQAYRVL